MKPLVLGLTGFALACLPSTVLAAAGGQGFVCWTPQDKITDVRLADYYEGPNTIGYALDTGPTTGEYMDTIQYVLNRLAKIDPASAQRYLTRAQSFESDALFTSDTLTLVDDANEPVQPQPGCRMAQFAIQNYPPKPLQKKYTVDQKIWAAADSVTKAGLVLNEVIRTDALALGQLTADGTRYYNYVVSSTAMAGITSDAYVAVLGAAQFNQQVSGFVVNFLFSVVRYGFTTYPNTVPGALFIRPALVKVTGKNVLVDRIGVDAEGKLNVVYVAQYSGDGCDGQVGIEWEAGNDIWASTFEPTPAGFDCHQGIPASLPMTVGGSTVQVSTSNHGAYGDYGIGIDPSGNLNYGMLVGDVSVQVQGRTVRLIAASDTLVIAWGNGALKSAEIEGGVKLLDTNHSSVNLANGLFGAKKYYYVTFDQSGNLASHEQVELSN